MFLRVLFINLFIFEDQILIVTWSTCHTRQNTSCVVTKLCEYHFCHDKCFVATNTVATNVCCDKRFVATNMIWSQQTCILCRDKRRVLSRRDKHFFVATKMILVAAPANDILWPPLLAGCNRCGHLWGMSYNSCWLLAATVEDCVGDQESRITQQSFLLPDVLFLLFGSTCSGCYHTWSRLWGRSNYSAITLAGTYLACPHLTVLWLSLLAGCLPPPRTVSLR